MNNAEDTQPKELPSELMIYFDPPVRGAVGKEHDAICLRAPTYKEFKEAKKLSRGKDDADMQMGAFLIRMISGTTDEMVDNMPIPKLMEAIEYLMGFFEAGGKANSTGSSAS